MKHIRIEVALTQTEAKAKYNDLLAKKFAVDPKDLTTTWSTVEVAGPDGQPETYPEESGSKAWVLIGRKT